MKFKKLIGVALISGLGYSAYKLARHVSQYNTMKDALPEYLLDVLGSRPVVKTQFRTKSIFLEIGYPQNLLDNNANLEKIVKDYVSDYYPLLAGYKVIVKTYSTDY